MASIEVSQKLRGEKQLDSKEIIEFIKNKLEDSCKYSVQSETDDEIEIKGHVKEKLFTRFAKFTAEVKVKTSENKARINIKGSSTPNWIFWLFIVIGLFTGVFFVIALLLYWFQKDKPEEQMEKLLKAVDTEFGEI